MHIGSIRANFGSVLNFSITQLYTEDWGAYERHLRADQRVVGKGYTQKIERKKINPTNPVSDWLRKRFFSPNWTNA